MKKLFLIPARGGSKGIPGKNVKLLGNRPLIYYTIDAANAAFESGDRIVVSTDSDEIAEVVRQYGNYVPFIRPAELASDTAGSREVILHALDFFEQKDEHFDCIVLLQPTSPFRKGTHVKEALKLYRPSFDMVVSAFETKSNPYYVLFEENSGGFIEKSKQGNFTRRQDCPKVFELNGAIYVINPKSVRSENLPDFKHTRVYEMNAADSVDLDTSDDWAYAEYLLHKSS